MRPFARSILAALLPRTSCASQDVGLRIAGFITGASTSGPTPDECYDVVIVGGGMPQPITFTPPPVPELRVSTVTPGSIAVLQTAGAWEQVAAHSSEFRTMQVWDTCSPGFIRWDAQETGAGRMGVVAENTLLQASLLDAAQRSGKRTEFVWPAEVRALRLPTEDGADRTCSRDGGAADGSGSWGVEAGPRPQHGLAELELADGRVLASRLVVAADGAASRIRSMAGLRTWGWGYGQRGLVATVETAEPSDTAWQRFLPTGPLALLPLRDGFSGIVWSGPPELATALERMGPAEFGAAVNQALRDPPTSPLPILGLGQGAGSSSGPLGFLGAALQRWGPALGGGGGGFQEPPLVTGWAGAAPRSFPLQLKQSGRYVLPRLALVGDAAHAVHPLAGQGVNLGFGDARVLAEALAGAVEAGADPGDAQVLADGYEAPRRRAVLTMVAALDGVKKAFEVQAAPLAALRGAGLGLINAVGPLRNGIMQYAMMGQA
ncbi:hypothetical protein GPECTOR_17g897 [Gonium pectorale]|uniref:FAD-binding domain-containing protein n=1 Tax=Gonium pectorale TaxID=33097 RepID=A0A150GK89_GONPE|nr:hypothetical protein GPECTOR_17g897 [Gonium pectorale]|eukprot:KXZ50259.1 hypothetical protein GPECTOR_17g897 [Gonium pectorale]